MINQFSSNFIALPDIRALSYGRRKQRVPASEELGITDEHSARAMNRWIARWENEGGAILLEGALG
jgi:hypothetical protein